ncbi:uncharacterized protein LOC115586188 isoform X2 [Sparus aurata]|uniref:uncharacterized protein LOC115586188 isoform X2 n=1 Tax=Sparus aurata TaxID=8175 RepID=UPI0011C14074|nr:uncharacterized protein LOC115586188 isoform X2 [Sparus aurata]
MPDEDKAGLNAALKELERHLSASHCDVGIDDVDTSPPTAAMDWKTRNALSSERWKEARRMLLDNMLKANNIKPRLCQRCLSKEAIIRCQECMPMQYYCCDCGIHHESQAPHNRQSMIHGFHMPLPPTVVVKEAAEGGYSHHTCARILPMEMPHQICDCPPENVSVIPGRPVVFINMKGRYDLTLPELRCGGCCASWTPGLYDVQVSGYCPATDHYHTIYDVAIFQAFREMKLAAPGISRLTFMRMLEAQTTAHGRTGKVCSDTFFKSFMEWVISSYEVDKLCSEQPFACTACSPQMLAVSVDGNRKHYRFKKDGHSEEGGYFDGVLICKDDEVAAFVDDLQKRAKHLPGKGVCGRSQLNAAKETTSKRACSSLDEQGLEVAVCRHGIILWALNMYRGEIFAYPMFLQKEITASPPAFFCMDVICKYWPYIQRIAEACPEYSHLTTMKPLLSVLHAKAHGIKCEIKWGGGSQDGAGSTLGEEVEMVNSFLSRTAIITKFMGKGARTDMLTVQIMDWNKRKMENMCKTLCTRFRKTQQNLERERQSLETLKGEMSANDGTVEQWVRDVQDWAEHVRSRIEETSLGLRQRRARLYSQTDSNSGSSVIRNRMWREQKQLEIYVAQHDTMVQPQEQIGTMVWISLPKKRFLLRSCT